MIHKLKMLLTLAVIVVGLCGSGCFGHNYPNMAEGDYILEKSDSFQKESTEEELCNFISNVRLELRKIDKQTYDNAKKVNVVSDFTREQDDSYFSFNVYLFDVELNEYRHIDFLYKFDNRPEVPMYFFGTVDQENNYNIDGIIFEYRNSYLHISFNVAGDICDYVAVFDQ